MASTLARLPRRRLLLLGGLGVAGQRQGAAGTAAQVFRLATRRCRMQVTVEFHDSYASRGLWLANRGGAFCVSLNGGTNQECMRSFVGSLAIARYEVSGEAEGAPVATLRESVRDIDRDDRLQARAPFQRRVKFEGGVASDIQAFGYEDSGAPAGAAEAAETPWYYFRQDLYLDAENAPFVILHWKHELSAIRLLDLIPGGGTTLVSAR